jgi:ATP-dependent RNA helicase SUPV3L1/SUV3
MVVESFIAWVSEYRRQEIYEMSQEFLTKVELGNLRYPSKWFPEARKMKRKIIAHFGPTNSGKTHHAMEAFKQVKRAIYCSPLRLLAIEKYEQLNADGFKTALITGEVIKGPKLDSEAAFESINFDRAEQDLEQYGYSASSESFSESFAFESLNPNKKQHPALERFKFEANYISCTVEMADFHTVYDLAIIDEIQMMAEEHRGWAFTHALLGIQAKEIHVCGDPISLPLIQALCQEAGDSLEIIKYNRLAKLHLAEPLEGFNRSFIQYTDNYNQYV